MIKIKRLEVMLALSVCLSQGAYSAGVGDIVLCPPGAISVVAKIPILDVASFNQSEISAKLASDSDLALTGITHSEEVRSLSIIADYTLALAPVIRISGCHQGNDQSLKFLLDLRWPQGRLLREYSIAVKSTVIESLEESNGKNILDSKQLSYQSNNESGISRQTETIRSISAASPVSEIVNYSTNNNFLEAGSFYLVKPGETIWGIASRLISNREVNKRIEEIIALNPRAFMNMDENLLRADAVLKLP
tara:strand:- start:2180 stop:2926 length:747 start_codon:yes stop_codon:yes gene_type:complete